MRLLIYAYLESVPFTRAVLTGESSLGGSESACLGLMEALARRGHDVHLFAVNLEAGCEGEWRGVSWHQAETLPDTLAFARPDVFVSLRMPQVFSLSVPGKLNILWAQDLMTDPNVVGQMAQVDHVAYVSAFHRKQWEGLQPVLAPLGWVTRNGISPADVPDLAALPKTRHRFLYTSRPERGLRPLLAMWPAIRAALPDAELQICRYRSMYDGEGSNVAQACSEYDRATAQVQQQVGGITILGHLNKPQLYQALAGARLLLYPGVQDFAETNGIAWTEAQACGTPIVSSWKGAAPETIHPDAGVLLDGDAMSAEYQARFVAEVVRLAGDDAAWSAMREAGIAYALPRCSHDTIAAEWDAQIHEWFEARYQANKVGVLRQLLHWDSHAAAQIVARDIGGDPTASVEDIGEAADAFTLCGRVLAQQEATEADYAKYAVQDVALEASWDGRLATAAKLIVDAAPARVLDVACGNGSMALLLSHHLTDATVDAWDSSAEVLKLGSAAVRDGGVSGRVSFHRGQWTEIRGVYDAVFCGEFIEHVEHPWALLDRLEQHCAPNGLIVLTCPSGPLVEILDPEVPRTRGHVHTFSAQDLLTMGEGKRDFAMQFLSTGQSPRGTAIGHWILTYRPGGAKAVPLDYTTLIHTERPYQRVVASMIVKDGADWLRKCLRSIRQVVDRVVILDTGSRDGSQALARSLGAEVVEAPWPDDFAAARNRALALVEAEAEWVLWIDADEELNDGHRLRKYATGAGPFAGYVVRQTHVMADQATFFDRPVRLFRTGRGVQFFGPVHEQPEDTPDAGIFPSLEVPDVQIFHLGYLTDRIRREKLTQRNLALLQRELASATPRTLAYVLAMRDFLNLATFARESAGGALTADARAYLLRAVALYQTHGLAAPAHRYHALAAPYYHQALDWLGAGWQVEWAFAAAYGRLAGRPKPERFRVRSVDEAEAELDARLTTWLNQMRGPVIDCEPFVTRNGAGGWGLAPILTDPMLLAQLQG